MEQFPRHRISQPPSLGVDLEPEDAFSVIQVLLPPDVPMKVSSESPAERIQPAPPPFLLLRK